MLKFTVSIGTQIFLFHLTAFHVLILHFDIIFHLIARQSGFKKKKSVSVLMPKCGVRRVNNDVYTYWAYTVFTIHTLHRSMCNVCITDAPSLADHFHDMLYISVGGSADFLSFTANHL